MYKFQNTDLVILVGGKGKRLKSCELTKTTN